ncbi:5023_t:CDS:2 [Acaulospora colombiana]|uniref:5023_t:CDS:1 n=1 Tax=Acaulospora colombiana TaxID=27376 RepID=A0ACA9L855_9GLOM|nr:5023_t:CDS:2 [Acaulospora colombiana]
MALWDEWGVRQPCTVLQLENVQVVQIKENAKFVKPDLVSVQIGCTDKEKNVPRPQLGHFKSAGVSPKWKLIEFHVTQDAVLPVGRVFKGKKMAGRMGGNNCTAINARVLKIDNALNLIYVKGPVPGHDGQFVRIRDSVNKKGAKCFPPDCIPPPFPTVDPQVENVMPRELVAKTGGIDPFALKES